LGKIKILDPQKHPISYAYEFLYQTCTGLFVNAASQQWKLILISMCTGRTDFNVTAGRLQNSFKSKLFP